MLLSNAADVHGRDHAEQPERHDQNDRERQQPALVERREHEVHEQHGQPEDEHAPRRRRRFSWYAMPVQSNPIVAGRTCVGDLLHLLERLAGTGPWPLPP